MSAPRVRGPRDVPALRAHLEAQWDTGHLRYPITQVVADDDGNPVARTSLGGQEWDGIIIREASSWWVSAEMCDVLANAEPQLPLDTVLEPELVPQPSGLVVFEHPLLGIDSDTGTATLQVDAILWGPVRLPPEPGFPTWRRALGISTYRRLNFDDGLSPDEMSAFAGSGAAELTAERISSSGNLHGDMWVPLGRSDWMVNTSLDHRHVLVADSDDVWQSMLDDRRRVATMWLLIAQEGIATTTEDIGSRPERRRAERHGEPAPTVRIVDVKRKRRAAPNEGTADDERRHLTVRFLVSGHWRQQAHGPGLQYRRPIWIHPHWRGPDDGPISGTEKVRVWR